MAQTIPAMNIETIREICQKLPGVTEDIKWGNDLCFLVATKMFCVTSLDGPVKISFKVTDEEFETLSTRPGIIPAPYMARHKWVLVEKATALK
jgi:predicted DNA-binding protein (MmcQ/YjbR family)